jgi:hypothetical protein
VLKLPVEAVGGLELSSMHPAELEAKTVRLTDDIARLRQQMRELDAIKEQLKTQPDGQISRTDPDSRSMATSARG